MATQIRRERVFQVPPETLYRVITDFENYKKFLPEVVGSEVLSSKDDRVFRVRFEIDLMKRFAYELEFTLHPQKEVHWRLLESDFFKTNQGRWVLEEKSGATKVQYELEVGFGFLVPGWITKKLTESNLPLMFDKFEKRAQEMRAL